MRTGRSFTICRSLLSRGRGGCLLQGVSAPGGGWGVSAPGGSVCWGVSAPGGSALGGISAPGGCLLRGGCLLLGDVCSGGSALGGCLLQGVSAPGGCLLLGVSAPGGCLLLGGCLLQGVSAPGGVYSQGGCLLLRGVGIAACTEADTPLLTESQTPVKTLPWPNFVAAGNYRIIRHKQERQFKIVISAAPRMDNSVVRNKIVSKLSWSHR